MIFDTLRRDTLFTDDDKKRAVNELIGNTAYNSDFRVLLIGSIVIATSAIFTDSIPVLIASMIIAPLATPILALGLGIAARDRQMILRAVGLLLLSCTVALIVAALLTLILGKERVATDTFVSFSSNRVVAVIIALTAGFIGAYGMLSRKVGSAVTGVAIAVSLMPPLVATSINFTSGNTALSVTAGILFLLNVIGILFASTVVFWWFGVDKAEK